jgi:hypothetical protein
MLKVARSPKEAPSKLIFSLTESQSGRVNPNPKHKTPYAFIYFKFSVGSVSRSTTTDKYTYYNLLHYYYQHTINNTRKSISQMKCKCRLVLLPLPPSPNTCSALPILLPSSLAPNCNPNSCVLHCSWHIYSSHFQQIVDCWVGRGTLPPHP